MPTRAFLTTLLAASMASLAPPPVAAQTTRDSVLAVVGEFFRAMTANDAAASQRVMTADGQYYAVGWQGDSVTIRRVTNAQYFDRLRSSTDRIVERIWEPTVLVHGPIANVWAPYDIHRNGAFLHCGVDNFALIRFPDGWKIAGMTFTMEPTGCRPSPLGPLERE